MSIYQKIYTNLCYSRSQLQELWKPKSNIHRHHIKPKHAGGTEDESNFTYLTIREHIIAHFLLWKIYKNPNDLRSMKLLGARLSSSQRKIIGEWCRDNNIGFFNAPFKLKSSWQKKGIRTQIDNNIGIHTKCQLTRKKYAILGGKKSIKSSNNPWSYWASSEGRKERASLGGKAHKGKRCMYKPGSKTFIRVKPEDIENKLSLGYVFGSPNKLINKT